MSIGTSTAPAVGAIPEPDTTEAAPSARTLVIACGALARELLAITRQHGLDGVVVECLPAALHNRPSEIPEAVRARIRRARAGSADDETATSATTAPTGASEPAPRAASGDPSGPAGTTTGAGTDPVDHVADPVEGATWSAAGRGFDRIFVGYADCGTGGLLDAVCADEGVERLPGAHCYEFFATADGFARLQDHELGTFYLTDFLVRHFDRLVWEGLGLDRHPELLPMYFGNYTRLVHLAQTDDPSLVAAARSAARRLGLDLTVVRTGYGELETGIVSVALGSRRASGSAVPDEVAATSTDVPEPLS